MEEPKTVQETWDRAIFRSKEIAARMTPEERKAPQSAIQVTTKDRAWADRIEKELERTDLTLERREELREGLHDIGEKYANQGVDEDEVPSESVPEKNAPQFEVTAEDRKLIDGLIAEIDNPATSAERRSELREEVASITMPYAMANILGDDDAPFESKPEEKVPQSPAEIAATPEFIAICAGLINSLWNRGVDTPENFAQVMHESFPDKISPRILAQVWSFVENSDPSQGVNWSQVLYEVRNPPSHGDVSDYDEAEDDDSPDNEIDELDQPIL
ncbi:MAG: hypothetical protein ACOYM3_28230, partial [Terrimicrobiaceae bacterium]